MAVRYSGPNLPPRCIETALRQDRSASPRCGSKTELGYGHDALEDFDTRSDRSLRPKLDSEARVCLNLSDDGIIGIHKLVYSSPPTV